METISRNSRKRFRGIPWLRYTRYSCYIYRVFCCLDAGNIVVLFNGFQKKTQKTPADEIARATRLMKEYFAKKKGETNDDK